MFGGFGHPVDISAQAFIAHVAEHFPAAIAPKYEIEIVKRASAFPCAGNLRMDSVSQPDGADEIPKQEPAGDEEHGIEQDQCAELTRFTQGGAQGDHGTDGMSHANDRFRFAVIQETKQILRKDVPVINALRLCIFP